MSKTITRKYIQRITRNENSTSIRRNSGGGGGGGGVSQYWVDDNYVSKEFFNRLFEIHDENGDPILPNDVETEIDNIQAMFGFWTNAYLSALGQNEGGGGAELTLASLADVAVQGVTDGQALVWSASQGKWVPGEGGGGLDPTAMWAELATTGTQQINKTHLTTALADYLPLAGGTMTGDLLVQKAAGYEPRIGVCQDGYAAIYLVSGSVSKNRGLYCSELGWLCGWDINDVAFFNGNATSASKLATARTIWGQLFDGTGNVSGSITGATTISASSTITGDTFVVSNTGGVGHLTFSRGSYNYINCSALGGSIGFITNGDTVGSSSIRLFISSDSNVGVGTYQPLYKLHVAGTFYASGNSSIGGTFGVTGATTLSSTLGVTGLITASGGITIPSGKTLTIGDAVLSWDSTNQGIKITKGLYSETFISALGKGNGGSSGISMETVWTALANSDSSKQINISHLTNALSGYNPTNNFKTINGESIIGTGNIEVQGAAGDYLPLSGGTLAGVLTISPTNTSAYQDALVLHDSGGGANEGARIRFTSYSYPTGITLGGNTDKTGLIINGIYTVYHSGNLTNVSQLTNDSGYVTSSGSVSYASSAGSVAWSNVSGRPTNVSSFTNDSGYITSSASITGNAGSATKLQTPRTIWGQSFDGTADVSGSITGATTISASSTITGDTFVVSNTGGVGHLTFSRGSYNYINCSALGGSIGFITNGDTVGSSSIRLFISSDSNVGVGTYQPLYKLHVAGTFYASGNSSIGGTFGVTGATTLSSTLGVTGLITASGGITIPSGKTLTIGDAVLSWDSTNQGIKITKGLYSETFISALGKGNGGSSGISMETVWTALANSDSSKQISISHLTNALSGYNPTSNFKTINGESIIGTGDIAISAGTGTVTSIVTGGTTYSPTNGVVTLPDNIIYTIDDNGNYVNASFLKSDFSKKAAQKYIEFWDSAGGWFNFMLGTLYVVNNVGIGTTSPSYKLHVSGICAVDEGLYKRNADSHPLSLWRATDSNQKLDIYVHDVLAVLNASDSDGWSSFSFCTNGTEYVRFDGLNKYVGIGTTSPAYKLDVNGDVRADNFIGNFANKSVTASTLDGLAGSFTFEGNNLTTSGYDEVGIQVGSSVDKFQIIGKSGTLLVRQNDNGGTSTSGWSGWTMLPTKVYTSNQLTKTDQWYRVANLTTYGLSYVVSIRDNFYHREPTPATFIINTSYTNATITQIGRASTTPNSITKVRLVKYGNGTFHVEVYTPKLSGSSSASMSTPEVNIFNLGRENTSDGIALVHDPNDDTKWLEVDKNIASGETLIEEATISTETTASALLNARSLWGQSFDGTANISGNMTDVGTISASDNITITKSSTNDAKFAATNNNGTIELLTSSNRGVYDRTNTKWLIGTNGTNSWLDCGNVGIGTTSPAYKLDVNGDVQATNFRGNFVGNADSATKLQTARTIWGQSFDGTANVSGAITGATTISASSNVSVGGTLSVSGTSTLTGHVGIGTSPHDKYVLRANGEVYVSTGLTSHGYVTALSDIRHKDVMGDVKLTVSEVANAPAVKFLWKDRRQEGLQVGSIAQYWKKVLPETIVEAADGELTMSYGVIALLASIANAREIVNLKREISELKRKLSNHGILE